MCERLCSLLLVLFIAPAAVGQRLPRTVLPQHYVLTVTPDIESERFSGEVLIHVHVQQPTSSVVLNAAEITFRTAEVRAGGETQTARVTVDDQKQQATLHLDRPLPVGSAELRIAYDGILNRQLRGFYIGEASGKKYLASQLEATDARRAFPSFDEPDMKATFQINVIADQNHAVISNSPIESETASAVAGKRTVRFAVTPNLSTYHIALIVGDFACLSDTAQGIALRICAQPSQVELGRFAMQATKDLLVAFNQYFDVDYPFTKLDQIALTDFAAGAMENPGAITYRERVLLVDEKTAPIDRQRASTSTISHELAHIWFGDMVTMRWWDDIWLNEGFASWLGTRMLEVVRPQWTAATSDAGIAGRPMAADVLAGTRQIRKSAETPEEIDQLFDGIAYGKTAALLRMIESYVGREEFREGINLYLARNAWGNASAGDFAGAIDDATDSAVTEILNSYVSQPGVPLVRLRHRCEGEETIVELEQSRFVLGSARTTGAEAQIWAIPVCFSDGRCIVLRERQQSVRFSGCRSVVFPNDEGRGYYITALEPVAETALTKGRADLSASERQAFLRDQWLLVRTGARTLDHYLEVAATFGTDRHVADDVLGNLGYIRRHLADGGRRQHVERLLRDLASPILADLGWSVRPADTRQDIELRNKAIELLGGYADHEATIRRARELTNRWLRNPDSLSPELVADVARVAALAGDSRLYDAFLKRYRTTTSPNQKLRYLSLLSDFRDPALLRRTLQLTLTPEIRAQDMASVLAGVIGNPAGREVAWTFLNEKWPAVEAKLPPGHAGRIFSAVSNNACDAGWQDRIREFTAQHPVPHDERAVRLAVERIGACAELRTLNRQGT